MTILDFIAKWRRVDLKERSASQEHFLDLCNIFEHPTPAAADPTGEKFCFEKGAAKHGGGEGFADVWKKGFFGWEYKGKHKDLSAAYDQLLRYRDALESPPLLVLCDMDRIIVRTNFTGTVSAVHEIALEAIGEPRNIEIMRAVFHNPEALRPGRTSTAVTQDAAKQIAEIADILRKRGNDPTAVAHFLDRIVFCLFAEDAGLLPDKVFSREETKAIIESLLAKGKKTSLGARASRPPLTYESETVATSFTRAGETPALPGETPALPGETVALPGETPALAKPPREWHRRGYLPHFDHPGLVQTITFRLADSLPPPLRERLRLAYGKQDDPELRREIEESLDSGYGACHLRDPRIAKIVQDALLHFDGERYRLVAWVVMPNHVHAMIETVPGFRLDEIMHTWKSFTAKACNRLLDSEGQFWQEDYYDRYIRDAEHYARARRYIEENPVKAGLVKEPGAWLFGSASIPGSAGVPPALTNHEHDNAGGTPALPGHDDAGGTPALPAVSEAARDLVEKRDRWLNPEGMSAADRKKRTLTKLYNTRPAWLANCHARLDAAVAAAYGWPADLSDSEILERLLALNQERAGKE